MCIRDCSRASEMRVRLLREKREFLALDVLAPVNLQQISDIVEKGVPSRKRRQKVAFCFGICKRNSTCDFP